MNKQVLLFGIVFFLFQSTNEVDTTSSAPIQAKAELASEEKTEDTTNEYNFDCQTNKTKKTTQSNTEKELIPFKNLTINTNSDTIIYLESGTEISIPKKAFLTADGKEAKGEITIKFREFHSPASIALAEIPMEVDKKTMLLSGGMFEIKGEQESSDIKINPRTPLLVQLATNEKSEQFNQYHLNPKTNKWEDKGDLVFDTSTVADRISPEIEWWDFTEDFQDKTGYFNKNGYGQSIALAVKEDQGQKFRKWAKNPNGDSKGYFYSLYSKRRSPQLAKYRYLSWHLSNTNYPETVKQFTKLHNRKHEASHSFWNHLNVVKCEEEFQLHYSNSHTNQHLVVNAIPDVKSYPGDNHFMRRQVKWEGKMVHRINQIQKVLFQEAKQGIKESISGMNQKQVDRFVRKRAIKLDDVELLINARKTKLPNPKTPYKSQIRVSVFGVHNIDAPVSYFAYGAGNLLTSPLWLLKSGYNKYAKATKKRYIRQRRLGFTNILGEPRSHKTIKKITIIQKGNNTTREFKQENLGRLEYSAAYVNLGIVFLMNGTYKIIPPKEFKKFNRESSMFNFEPIEVSSKDHLKKQITELGFEI